jgi:hypothetical protein
MTLDESKKNLPGERYSTPSRSSGSEKPSSAEMALAKKALKELLSREIENSESGIFEALWEIVDNLAINLDSERVVNIAKRLLNDFVDKL